MLDSVRSLAPSIEARRLKLLFVPLPLLLFFHLLIFWVICFCLYFVLTDLLWKPIEIQHFANCILFLNWRPLSSVFYLLKLHNTYANLPHTSFQQFFSCLKSNCASAKLYKQLQICFPSPLFLSPSLHVLCGIFYAIYCGWRPLSVGGGVDKVEPIIMGALSFAFSDRFRLSCCTFAVTEIFLSRLQLTHRKK